MNPTLTHGANAGATLFTSGAMLKDHKPTFSFGKGTKSEGEVLTVKNVPVFRSGTFRDSGGYQHTWEDLHIDQMVTHYDHLVRQSIFEDVPVRKGHGSLFGEPMDGLIGWHLALHADNAEAKDGNEYRVLFADFEIFDEVAKEHISKGNWRNRSSEVGFYLTNSEAEFWPVYQGFAYVDIPAVEFLNSFSRAGNSTQAKFTVMTEEEVPRMADDNGNQNGNQAGSSTQVPENNNQAPTPVPVPAEGDAPAGDEQQASADGDQQPNTNSPQPSPAAPAAPGGTAEHASTLGGPQQTFTIGGQSTSDFAAVQSHIDTLESAAQENLKSYRIGIVEGLAADNKILATQIPAFSNMVVGMSKDGFDEWKASYDSVPSSTVLGQHGRTGGDSQAPTPSAEQDEVARLEGVVAMHSQVMSPENVEKTPSFKRLQELKASAGQSQS